MSFYTIEAESFAELEEKKSRFLAFLVPIAQFDEKLSQLRAEHRKANHHVTAFRRMRGDGRIEEGAKDDGEPGGTSGMPVLKTLIGSNLVDAGIIVVRYFGGTKLGTGGLARAYSGAAGLAIAQAGLCAWHRMVRAKLESDFASSSDLETRIQQAGVIVIERIYSETGVEIEVEGPEARVNSLIDQKSDYAGDQVFDGQSH